MIHGWSNGGTMYSPRAPPLETPRGSSMADTGTTALIASQ